ncbi:hypothetical protein ECG_08128 [Echinococcus granulosus]|nr:hypothetical protein ECG_08128 [Echinococcus granulosus]
MGHAAYQGDKAVIDRSSVSSWWDSLNWWKCDGRVHRTPCAHFKPSSLDGPCALPVNGMASPFSIVKVWRSLAQNKVLTPHQVSKVVWLDSCLLCERAIALVVVWHHALR